MSRHVHFMIDVRLLTLFSGAIYIMMPTEETSQHSLADFQPIAFVICGVGGYIAIQWLLKRIRQWRNNNATP